MTEWISVNQSMPKVGTYVHVKNDLFEEFATFTSNKHSYYFCIGNEIKQTWEPTHWMYVYQEGFDYYEKKYRKALKLWINTDFELPEKTGGLYAFYLPDARGLCVLTYEYKDNKFIPTRGRECQPTFWVELPMLPVEFYDD